MDGLVPDRELGIPVERVEQRDRRLEIGEGGGKQREQHEDRQRHAEALDRGVAPGDFAPEIVRQPRRPHADEHVGDIGEQQAGEERRIHLEEHVAVEAGREARFTPTAADSHRRHDVDADQGNEEGVGAERTGERRVTPAISASAGIGGDSGGAEAQRQQQAAPSGGMGIPSVERRAYRLGARPEGKSAGLMRR
jgi:hypothetical protein